MPLIPLWYVLAGTGVGGAILGAIGWNTVDDAIVDPLTGNRPLFDSNQFIAGIVLVGASVYFAKKFKVI